ncbi:MAG: WbqC family protein [Prevotellaceae bacterium]|nr:WbqC family protein [Prevotellaceae bacterium]
MSKALLSSTYFGPVQWYQKLNRYDKICIEKYDNFIKQTYRNRCIIATTNGIQALTIPVERTETSMSAGANGIETNTDSAQNGEQTKTLSKCMMKDIRISDHGNWRHIHWNALQSAYGESPFFEYYADDIRPFYEKKWTFLYDFNIEICAKMCELIDIQPNIEFTEKFISSEEATANGIEDYRDAIRPKHPLHDESFSPRRYYQVYEQKHGFIPNLSILDLLFNMGNESVLYL